MTDNKNQNLSASLEDYLEAIFNLSSEKSVARSRDIAETLSVSKASVTGALKMLKSKELINYEPYGYITLTEEGADCAAEVLRKHNILKSFFMNVLGVSKEAAQSAACKAEHDLGSEIISRFLCFIEFMESQESGGRKICDEFKEFASRRLDRERRLKRN